MSPLTADATDEICVPREFKLDVAVAVIIWRGSRPSIDSAVWRLGAFPLRRRGDGRNRDFEDMAYLREVRVCRRGEVVLPALDA